MLFKYTFANIWKIMRCLIKSIKTKVVDSYLSNKIKILLLRSIGFEITSFKCTKTFSVTDGKAFEKCSLFMLL